MEMIKKLRFRLITVSMLSLFAVLFIIVSAASLLNYRQLVQEADQVLDMLAENGGAFPDFQDVEPGTTPEDNTLPDGISFPGPGQPDSDGRLSDSNGRPSDTGDSFRRDKRKSLSGMRYMSAELPFESRYFSVIAGESGEAVSVDVSHIAAISEEEAAEYAGRLQGSRKVRGFLGNYRYLVSASSENETLFLFLDRGRNLETFRSMLLTSYGISLLGLLVVFGLIFFFSGRITRPFVENAEKQRRFITDAGHELKTPLAIIEADTDVLEMDLGEKNEWVEDIKKQTRRLAGLTKDLISLARSEEAGQSYTMIDFPVSDVIMEAAESYRAPAMAQGKSFRLKAEPMLTLTGDEASIRQLVGILLDNALKYSNPGGSISLTLSRQGKSLSLEVFNTAEHVSRGSLPHLFDRFYRADTSRNSGTGGYGIGLSIAQAIVQAHKGKISASTEDEKSLRIIAVFPGCTSEIHNPAQ